MAYHIAIGSYKKILKDAIDGYPFGTPDGMHDLYDSSVKKVYDSIKVNLDEAWNASKKSKWDIACLFHQMVTTGAYMAYDDKRRELSKVWEKAHPGSEFSWRDNPYSVIGGMAGMSNPINLIVFAKEEYGICRTDLYNMLAVVEEFGDVDGNIFYEGSLFTFYQLVEMLPLTYEQRKKIQPNWTIAEIRAYKKSLKSVQTSGQVVEEVKDEVDEVKDPKNDRYVRFDKFSRVDLCERIIELEEYLKKISDLYDINLKKII